MYRPHYDAAAQALYFLPDGMEERGCLQGRRNVFVCGALQYPEKMNALLGREAPFAPAVVVGYKRGAALVGGTEHPFMVPSGGEPRRVLTGILWLNLSEAELARIETLELKGDMRRPITVEALLGERAVKAVTYIRA